MKCPAFCLLAALTLAVAPAQAGAIKKTIGAMGALAVGAALTSVAIKAQCKKQRELDGSTSAQCAPQPQSAPAQAAEKSASGARELRRQLNAERIAAGMPPDPEDCEAHHIVPESDARKGLQAPAEAARSALDGCIDINSVENGIFLPGKQGAAGCDSPLYHRTIHTRENYGILAERLSIARQFGGCDGVRSELRLIKEVLMNGGPLRL